MHPVGPTSRSSGARVSRSRLSAVWAVLTALGLSACAANASADEQEHAANVGVPAGYRLTFSDEFDDDQLGSAWSTCYWWQIDGGCTIASNDEEEWYRPEAVTVEDGIVELTASKSPQRTVEGGTLPFRSGMISTGHVDNDVADPGFAFTYGFVEARVRFPVGAGTWPAVWLLSAERVSLPEIDLMEWYGNRPDVVTAHVHNTVDGERAKQRLEIAVDEAAGEWHDVAALWTADRIDFFFDGEHVGAVDDRDLIPSTPMYLILNLALGGPAGDVDPAALPTSFDVDWVKVWQEVTL